MRITVRLTSLLNAAALVVTAGLGTAAAQTVIVRSAPAGSSIELTMNSASAGTAKADASGDATLFPPPRTAEALVQFHVDVCGSLVRVHIVERGLQPPPAAAGCARTDVGSIFSMQPVTTFVVDITGSNAAVHLRQGPVPPGWLSHEAEADRALRAWGTPGSGLVLGAGSGFSSFQNAAKNACGNAVSCEQNNFGFMLAGTADFWFNRFVAADIAYVQPHSVTVNGTGDTYSFGSKLQTRLLIVAGKAGFSAGPARFYGYGGLNRHQSTSTTTNTIKDTTVVVNDVTQTIPGGTQTFARKTEGWNWAAGGGFEAWVKDRVAIYGELGFAKIKGDPIGGGEGGIDDRLTTIGVGVRVRLWR